MTGGSCFVLFQRFSHATGFMFCSFQVVFSCHRVHVLFTLRGFLMKQDSFYVLSHCFSHETGFKIVLSQRFSHDTGFMLCFFQDVFSCHRVHI